MAITIAVVNRNGGATKTTTVFSLAGAYARAGKSVCVLDLDPQADLTNSFKGASWTKAMPIAATAAAMFEPGSFATLEQLAVKTDFENLWLVPGSERLEDHDGLEKSAWGDREFLLRDFLSGANFDRLLIDCPPNVYFLSWSALAAVDFALVPTPANRKGLESIEYINRKIETVRASVNPGLRLLGYVLGRFKKKNPNHIGYAADLNTDFPGLVFEEFLPEAAAIEKAAHARKPIVFHSPKSEAARAVGRLVEEIERRIAGEARTKTFTEAA